MTTAAVASGAPTAALQLPASGGSAATAADGDAQRLSGLWFDERAPGEGFALELYADLPAAGDGIVQADWLAFEATGSGAVRQTRYTLSGAMVEGAAAAFLSIYRAGPGGADAASATPAQPVGTAMLVFNSCERAQLSYAFTDGSGRAGTIGLGRLAANAACTMTASAPARPEFAFAGNWYSATPTGQGALVEADAGEPQLRLAWYADAPAVDPAGGGSAPRWFTGQVGYRAGAQLVVVPLYATTGGIFDAADGASPSRVPVGTATLGFRNCSSATLAYAFTGGALAGRSGAIALTRLGAPPGCQSLQ